MKFTTKLKQLLCIIFVAYALAYIMIAISMQSFNIATWQTKQVFYLNSISIITALFAVAIYIEK
jgi:hypothetical protein